MMARRSGNKRQLLTMVLAASALAVAVSARRQAPPLQSTIYGTGTKTAQGPAQAQPTQGPMQAPSAQPGKWLVVVAPLVTLGVLVLDGYLVYHLLQVQHVLEGLDVLLTAIGATVISLGVVVGTVPVIIDKWFPGGAKGVEAGLAVGGSVILAVAAWFVIFKPH